MRFTAGAMIMLLAAQTSGPPASAQPAAPRAASPTLPAQGGGDQNAAAVRAMDETLARQERAANRATSGICEGCSGGRRGGARRTTPQGEVGEDGLTVRPEDLH
jgi:hypothetical protein